jgi:hypothetical protein
VEYRKVELVETRVDKGSKEGKMNKCWAKGKILQL